MIIVGLTGCIGSGKSTVSRIFYELGAYTVDADKISRKILEKETPAYFEVLDRFRSNILNSDKSIDRKALASIVFSDKEQLEVLNKITHKYIFLQMQKDINELKKHNPEVIILDVPLLFSEDFLIEYDKSVVVSANREVCINRVVERDLMTEKEAMDRIKNQICDDELRLRADYIINNNSDDLDELRQKVKLVYDDLILQNKNNEV